MRRSKMMKVITYERVTGDVTVRVEMPWSEENEVIAAREAAYGYTVTEKETAAAPLTVSERLAALERTVKAADYVPGTWYYRGDKVRFEDVLYTCVAPAGVVCVWSPAEYPAYWQEG